MQLKDGSDLPSTPENPANLVKELEDCLKVNSLSTHDILDCLATLGSSLAP